MATRALDIDWDGAYAWMHVAGRPMPADPATRDDIPDDPAWVAAVPLENQAALLVIVAQDANGTTRSATARLVIPAPEPGWHNALEAQPARILDGRISATATNPSDLPDWDWPQGGWWADITDAHELWRYTRLFGSLPIDR